MSLSLRKKRAFFVLLILPEEIFFTICVFCHCILHLIHFQNIHTLIYQKTLLHTLLLLVFKIFKGRQCTLKYAWHFSGHHTLMDDYMWCQLEYHEYLSRTGGAGLLGSVCPFDGHYAFIIHQCVMSTKMSCILKQNYSYAVCLGEYDHLVDTMHYNFIL